MPHLDALVTYGLLTASILALWFRPRTGSCPWLANVWLLPFLTSLGVALWAGFIKPVALPFIGAFVLCAYLLGNAKPATYQRSVAIVGIVVLSAAAAMGKSNLLHVALAARELAAPDADLIILADNDVKLDGSKPGLKAANEAAAAVGGRVAIPNLNGRKCDYPELPIIKVSVYSLTEKLDENLGEDDIYVRVRFTTGVGSQLESGSTNTLHHSF